MNRKLDLFRKLNIDYKDSKYDLIRDKLKITNESAYYDFNNVKQTSIKIPDKIMYNHMPSFERPLAHKNWPYNFNCEFCYSTISGVRNYNSHLESCVIGKRIDDLAMNLVEEYLCPCCKEAFTIPALREHFNESILELGIRNWWIKYYWCMVCKDFIRITKGIGDMRIDNFMQHMFNMNHYVERVEPGKFLPFCVGNSIVFIRHRGESYPMLRKLGKRLIQELKPSAYYVIRLNRTVMEYDTEKFKEYKWKEVKSFCPRCGRVCKDDYLTEEHFIYCPNRWEYVLKDLQLGHRLLYGCDFSLLGNKRKGNMENEKEHAKRLVSEENMRIAAELNFGLNAFKTHPLYEEYVNGKKKKEVLELKYEYSCEEKVQAREKPVRKTISRLTFNLMDDILRTNWCHGMQGEFADWIRMNKYPNMTAEEANDLFLN